MFSFLQNGPATVSIHVQSPPQWTNSKRSVNLLRPKVNLLCWSSLWYSKFCVFREICAMIYPSERTVLISKTTKFLLFIIPQTNLQRPLFFLCYFPLLRKLFNWTMKYQVDLQVELFSLIIIFCLLLYDSPLFRGSISVLSLIYLWTYQALSHLEI